MFCKLESNLLKKYLKWNLWCSRTTYLAVELSEKIIKIIEFHVRSGKPTVSGYVSKIITPGLIVQGVIHDVPKLTNELLSVYTPRHDTKYLVNIALNDEWVVKRYWTVNAQIKNHELSALIRLEISKWINFPIEEAYFDYKKVSTNHSHEFSYLIIACHSLLILSRQHLFENLGMILNRVEVTSMVVDRVPDDVGSWRIPLGLCNQIDL